MAARRGYGMQSKDEVNYVGHPVDGKQCSGCTMFRSPRACTNVEGKISPEGYCKIHDDLYGDANQEHPLDKAIRKAMALDQGE